MASPPACRRRPADGRSASAPAPSNPQIPLSSEIASLLSEWLQRWQKVKAPDSPFPLNTVPNPQDIQWLWQQPQHFVFYSGLEGNSKQVFSTFALPLESRPGDRDYLWEDPPFDTGVDVSSLTSGAPGPKQIASAPYRESPAVDYLLAYWMAVYLGLLK